MRRLTGILVCSIAVLLLTAAALRLRSGQAALHRRRPIMRGGRARRPTKDLRRAGATNTTARFQVLVPGTACCAPTEERRMKLRYRALFCMMCAARLPAGKPEGAGKTIQESRGAHCSP